VDGSSPSSNRRMVSPSIVVSGLFVAACAVFAVAFTAARGGLQLPISSRAPVGVVAPVTSGQPARPSGEPSGTPRASSSPTERPPALTPSASQSSTPTERPAPPTPVTTAPPTLSPTGEPRARPTLEPGDPLLALVPCPDHPGCVEYVVRRGDTLSGIISRYLLDIDVLLVLNPDLDDPNLVVLGQTLFLGRDPYVRLDPCLDAGGCWLYPVRRGDSIAEIALRFGVTSDAILEVNPGLPRPIVPGQVLRLPEPAPA
jgi:nucleoid-associated protein YgaU